MATLTIERDDALVIVDPQNDFLPGGALAVAEGERIFEPINRSRRGSGGSTRPATGTRPTTRSSRPAAGRGRCLAGSHGAAFSPRLRRDAIHAVISKGTDPQTDGYSGFAATDLERDLREHGVRRLFIAGLATDYCVKATALDARRLGFDVVVLTDAIAAVNLDPGDEAAALEAMRRAGIQLATSAEIAGEDALLHR